MRLPVGVGLLAETVEVDIRRAAHAVAQFRI
jgi:hypothetical protein